MAESILYEVGQRVRATKYLGDAPSGDSPGGCYAMPGEELIVRRVNPEGRIYQVYVSHEDVTDGSFGVEYHEIEPVNPN